MLRSFIFYCWIQQVLLKLCSIYILIRIIWFHCSHNFSKKDSCIIIWSIFFLSLQPWYWRIIFEIQCNDAFYISPFHETVINSRIPLAHILYINNIEQTKHTLLRVELDHCIKCTITNNSNIPRCEKWLVLVNGKMKECLGTFRKENFNISVSSVTALTSTIAKRKQSWHCFLSWFMKRKKKNF